MKRLIIMLVILATSQACVAAQNLAALIPDQKQSSALTLRPKLDKQKMQKIALAYYMPALKACATSKIITHRGKDALIKVMQARPDLASDLIADGVELGEDWREQLCCKLQHYETIRKAAECVSSTNQKYVAWLKQQEKSFRDKIALLDSIKEQGITYVLIAADLGS